MEQDTATPSNSVSVMSAVGLGTWLIAVTISAANLALPTLSRELGISVELSRWVLQAYLLSMGVLLLPSGKLADAYGHRRVYLGGFLLLGVASLGCGLAGHAADLIMFRALQGVGSAMIMATGPAILTTNCPPQDRGKALGMLGTATYVGLSVGPPLGGWLVSTLGWRWTFALALPASLLVVALGLVCLPPTSRAAKPAYDWRAALTLAIGCLLLLIAINQGQRWGARSALTWAAPAAGIGVLWMFARQQRRRERPFLDLGLFRSPVFIGAVLSAVANYVALFVPMFLMPFYLEEGLSWSPALVGRVLMAQPLVMAMVTWPAGWLSDRIGTRGLAAAGMGVLAVGLYGLSTAGGAGAIPEVAAWLALIGLGTGIFISPNSSALMGAAGRGQQGTAGSFLAEARIVGMMTGVALGSGIFHAAGGRTGQAWQPGDFQALRLALLAAGGASLLGACAALVRPRSKA